MATNKKRKRIVLSSSSDSDSSEENFKVDEYKPRATKWKKIDIDSGNDSNGQKNISIKTSKNGAPKNRRAVCIDSSDNESIDDFQLQMSTMSDASCGEASPKKVSYNHEVAAAKTSVTSLHKKQANDKELNNNGSKTSKNKSKNNNVLDNYETDGEAAEDERLGVIKMGTCSEEQDGESESNDGFYPNSAIMKKLTPKKRDSTPKHAKLKTIKRKSTINKIDKDFFRDKELSDRQLKIESKSSDSDEPLTVVLTKLSASSTQRSIDCDSDKSFCDDSCSDKELPKSQLKQRGWKQLNHESEHSDLDEPLVIVSSKVSASSAQRSIDTGSDSDTSSSVDEKTSLKGDGIIRKERKSKKGENVTRISSEVLNYSDKENTTAHRQKKTNLQKWGTSDKEKRSKKVRKVVTSSSEEEDGGTHVKLSRKEIDTIIDNAGSWKKKRAKTGQKVIRRSSERSGDSDDKWSRSPSKCNNESNINNESSSVKQKSAKKGQKIITKSLSEMSKNGEDEDGVKTSRQAKKNDENKTTHDTNLSDRGSCRSSFSDEEYAKSDGKGKKKSIRGKRMATKNGSSTKKSSAYDSGTTSGSLSNPSDNEYKKMSSSGNKINSVKGKTSKKKKLESKNKDDSSSMEDASDEDVTKHDGKKKMASSGNKTQSTKANGSKKKSNDSDLSDSVSSISSLSDDDDDDDDVKPGKKRNKKATTTNEKSSKKKSEDEDKSESSSTDDASDEDLTNQDGKKKKAPSGNKKQSSAKSKNSRKGRTSKTGKEVDSVRISRLKRYIWLCGIRKHYQALFNDSGCRTEKARVNVLMDVLREAGIKGQPTLDKCKKIKKKREKAEELAELDADNIISVTSSSGRTRRTNVHSMYLKQTPQKDKPFIQNRERVQPEIDHFANLRGIISSGSDSD